MDNDEDDFINYNITKRKKSKRNKDVSKYTKTCAIYGIFDCTCCKKEENTRIYDSVIDETINQPSTSRSRLSNNEDDTEQNSNDDFIDVGTDCVPGTSNKLSLEELKINKEEICDRKGTNENVEIDKPPEDVSEYENSENEESVADDLQTELNEIDNMQLVQPNDSSDENLDISMDATLATSSDSLATLATSSDSLATNETISNDSIKSEVLPVTEEEEEEIDVVNIPTDDIQNILIENNTEPVQQDTVQNENENEIKRELSDDENQIIDILNLDGTDRREDLVNNLENQNTNMESTSNANEDEIIDVENLNEETPSSFELYNADLAELRLRRRHLRRRRLRSQITININKKPRLVHSVMTIDLINSPRDDSIIEITDSPVVPRKVTEVINVDDDDDDNEDSALNTTCSPPHRKGLGNCPVCLESLAKTEIMSTICGHVYCARCIKNVIKTTKKCPTCRKNLTLKSIHPLFI